MWRVGWSNEKWSWIHHSHALAVVNWTILNFTSISLLVFVDGDGDGDIDYIKYYESLIGIKYSSIQLKHHKKKALKWCAQIFQLIEFCETVFNE